MKRFIGIVILICLATAAYSQHVKIDKTGKNLTFTGTEAIENDATYDSTEHLVLSGYVSSYYAFYSDSIARSGYQKFPTTAPYNNRFGINIVQLGGTYTSEHIRAIFTLHFGDIPQSAWSPQYNMIQEANVGFLLAKDLWFDMGYFRTHIGLESIQPRENIASSIAMATYFEPYFLSGAKLTYRINEKLAIQANAFNGFNTYVETNKNKAVGLSAVITPSEDLMITVNTITSDESPDSVRVSHQRLYNNIYLVYKIHKIDFGAEFNYGLQRNTKLSDPSQTAHMHSALLAIEYKFNSSFAVYGREEFFSDPDEILTGPVENSHHELIGLNFTGTTLGVEYKPIENSYVRLEGRTLHTKSNQDIFKINDKSVNHREEVIFSVGVWF